MKKIDPQTLAEEARLRKAGYPLKRGQAIQIARLRNVWLAKKSPQ